MNFKANIFVSEEKKPIRKSSIIIETEAAITVADVKTKCYESIEFPKDKTYDKSGEEVWLPNQGFNKNNQKPEAAADDFLIEDERKIRVIEYYVTVAEKK